MSQSLWNGVVISLAVILAIIPFILRNRQRFLEILECFYL